jgi:hypothetical protein
MQQIKTKIPILMNHLEKKLIDWTEKILKVDVGETSLEALLRKDENGEDIISNFP